MHPKEVEIFAKRIELRVKQSLISFHGKTVDDECVEEMAKQLAEDVGPIVAEYIGPLIKNLRAVNLSQGKVEITGEFVRESLDKLKNFSQTGDVSPLLEVVDRLRRS